MTELTTGSLKPFLRECGYRGRCLKTGTKFAGMKEVALVGFAHEPTDARSACIAALDVEGDLPGAVASCLPLGAPVVMACHANRLHVFKQRKASPDRVENPLAPNQLRGFFAQNADILNPQALYRLKTRGRLLESAKPQQLKFVDIGLMRLVDEDMGRELTGLVERVVGTLAGAFTGHRTEKQGRWMLQWAFRLLAGKILRDKGVPAFADLNLVNFRTVSRLVGNHYRKQDARLIVEGEREQAALSEAAAQMRDYAHLGRVTTEALADVYESALVTKQTRKALGTHSTPGYLADYVVWQLADWIERIPLEELRVFEPACGHSAFLVSVMRFLREAHPDLPTARRNRLYRERLSGIELDPFALEIAMLNLTLADVPNPDGWSHVVQGDMFKNGGDALKHGAKQCTLLLANPPFEEGKALRVLRETIPHLPIGAVFGFVLPQAIIYSPMRSVREFRDWLVRNSQISEICAFPQGMFKFSDHESGLLLGRRIDPQVGGLTRTTFRAVRDKDKERFKERYATTTRYDVPQQRFLETEDLSFWVPDLDEVWTCCAAMQTLGSIAEVGKGLEHKSRDKREDERGLPEDAITVLEKRPRSFVSFHRGFTTCLGAGNKVVGIHELPVVSWLNIDPNVIRTPGTGTTTGEPQILMNYGRVTRVGTWRVVAYLDYDGHAFNSSFLSIRPTAPMWPLEYLWALCNSPIASAFAYCHTLKRHNTKYIMDRMPCPNATEQDVGRVVRAVRMFRGAAQQFDVSGPSDEPNLFHRSTEPQVNKEQLRELLLACDTEVLRLYALPAWAERRLLNLFADSRRKGVPFDFGAYYPPDFKDAVPLHAFRSETYQRFLKTGEPEVTDDMRQRYDTLIDKRLSGKLSPEEDDGLYRLEAEMDGSDYAAQPPDNSWREAREAERHESERTLDGIASRIVDLARTGDPADAHHP